MKSPPNNEAQYTATLRVDHYFFFGARDPGFGDTFSIKNVKEKVET